MRTLTVLLGMMFGLGAPALAAETSPAACAKVVNLERLKAATGANWTVMPSIVTVETDRLSCSFLSPTLDMVMVYVRPDADRGEWKIRQALHKGETEPMKGVGDEAFLLHERGNLGLVAYAKKTSYVITGFPGADEARGKAVLTEMAKSVIAAY